MQPKVVARLVRTALILITVMATGCAGGMDYKKLGGQLAADKCTEATAYLEKTKEAYGPNRKLLYLMDAGSVNLYCGNYSESATYFQEADQLSEELWTKSITKEGAAFLVNDYTIPYAGEDFEKALINAFGAIDYTMLGNYDEALVECRRLNSKLELLNARYEEKSVYKEDAFGRYLSGLIYEAQDPRSLESLDNAFIDYNRAVEVFKDYSKAYGTPMPQDVMEDYFRVAQAVGRMDEAKRSAGSAAPSKWISQKEVAGMGRIVLIHLNGRSPVKEDESIVAATPNGPIKIAFPKFRVTEPSCQQSSLVVESADGAYSEDSSLVEDINKIAVKNLNDRKLRVVAKTIARAVAKQAAIDAASKQVKDKDMRKLTKFGLNVLNTVVERADTRTWRTLPAEIFMTRVFVPAGDYSVLVQRCGSSRKFIDTVSVGKGQTRFVLLETIF